MPQSGWRHCGKCQGLFFGGNRTSVCPARGAHTIATDITPPKNFTLWLKDDDPGYQGNWQWCNKCQGLFFGGEPSGYWSGLAGWFPSTGVCPAGGSHAYEGSGGYVLGPDLDQFRSFSAGWAWCNKCQGLFRYQNTLNSGTCPAGGGHNLADSISYTIGVNP
jgi:hypothetical protein